LRPASVAASVPTTIATSELIATRPLNLSIVCALITLKPNQPCIDPLFLCLRSGQIGKAKQGKHHNDSLIINKH
jgi:hypothetical protein